jgi:hypothetical protein
LHPDTVPNVDLTTILREGLLGRFWVIDGKPKGHLDESAAVSGSVHLLGNEIQAKTLLPVGTPVTGPYEIPQDRWLVGITDAGMIMMPTVSGELGHFSFFGERAAVRTFRGPAVIAGIISQPFGPRITRLSMLLPYPDWAGLDPMSRQPLLDAQQRLVGMDIQLRGKGPLNGGRSNDSIDIELQGTWSATDDESVQQTGIRPLLEVISTSARPRDLRQHIDVASRIQDLVSLAYDRYLAAHSARVTVEGAVPEAAGPRLWHAELARYGLEPTRRKEIHPLFRLGDLGGSTALHRWIRLTRQYPDAADAIRVQNRAGFTLNARLVQLGAAIEHYVGQNTAESRRKGSPVQWTKQGPTFASALARRAGKSFAKFINDPDKWGELFGNAYRVAKHPGTPRETDERLRFFNASAQVLLVCILLDRAAGSRQPSTVLLSDPRLANIAQQANKIVI